MFQLRAQIFPPSCIIIFCLFAPAHPGRRHLPPSFHFLFISSPSSPFRLILLLCGHNPFPLLPRGGEEPSFSSSDVMNRARFLAQGRSGGRERAFCRSFAALCERRLGTTATAGVLYSTVGRPTNLHFRSFSLARCRGSGSLLLSSRREKEGDSAATAKLKGAVDFLCVKENNVFPLKGCYEREREILIFERIFAFPPKEGQREKTHVKGRYNAPLKRGGMGVGRRRRNVFPGEK